MASIENNLKHDLGGSRSVATQNGVSAGVTG